MDMFFAFLVCNRNFIYTYLILCRFQFHRIQLIGKATGYRQERNPSFKKTLPLAYYY